MLWIYIVQLDPSPAIPCKREGVANRLIYRSLRELRSLIHLSTQSFQFFTNELRPPSRGKVGVGLAEKSYIRCNKQHHKFSKYETITKRNTI
jgi:hypothetical protein